MGRIIDQWTNDLGAEGSCTDWSAWGPPVRVADDPPLFKQCRWMDCREERTTQVVYLREPDPTCPPGYHLGGCAG